MSNDNEFRIRPGQIRSGSAQRLRPFVNQAMAAAQKAGATITRNGRIGGLRNAGFGRGRLATVQANRLLTNRSRIAIIKARVVRHSGKAATLANHLRYLRREGVSQDGDKAVLFGPEEENPSPRDFNERCEGDRHHFRFIVSPEDALDMEDLKGFTRDLMRQAQKDLGTKLDRVSVSHWNTDQPHVHIIVRGVTDQGDDLVISREYIKEGMRARAQELITDELGPRTDHDIHQHLTRQIEAERFTQLDRQLISDSRRFGFIDLAPAGDHTPDSFHLLKVGRIRKLESLGLADQFAPGQWVIADHAPTTLASLGERGDIIKRIHRGLTSADQMRTTASFAWERDAESKPIVGRLLEKGLDDELKGSAYAIIDGTDGRTHHVKLPSLEAIGAERNAIVEARIYGDASSPRHAIVVHSDFALEAQIKSEGAAWIDRVAVSERARGGISQHGFGAVVHDAIRQRAEHLIEAGLAIRGSAGVEYRDGLLDAQRNAELAKVARDITKKTGGQLIETREGDYASGTYRQRLQLASGRFAVLEDGLGFRLVPWSPTLEGKLGQHVSGTALPGGRIDWSHGRQRGLGIG